MVEQEPFTLTLAQSQKHFTLSAVTRMKTPVAVSVMVLFSALIATALPGCAQYDNRAMAGDAVDIPDAAPLSEQPPVITRPTPGPSPAETVRQLLGQ